MVLAQFAWRGCANQTHKGKPLVQMHRAGVNSPVTFRER